MSPSQWLRLDASCQLWASWGQTQACHLPQDSLRVGDFVHSSQALQAQEVHQWGSSYVAFCVPAQVSVASPLPHSPVYQRVAHLPTFKRRGHRLDLWLRGVSTHLLSLFKITSICSLLPKYWHCAIVQNAFTP